MKKIRHNIFETNSSSTHSISISPKDSGILTKTKILDVELEGFGWGVSSHNDARTKLSYALVYIQYRYKHAEIPYEGWVYNANNVEEATQEVLEWLEKTKYAKWLHEMVLDFTGQDFVIQKAYDDIHPLGYIDHQSLGILNRFWSEDESKFKENMKNFIFNNEIQLIIDNDNHW